MKAVDVGFGPPSGHPDVLATLQVDSICVQIGIECKRVQPTSEEERLLAKLGTDLDSFLQTIVADHGSIKVIVWLHQPAVHAFASMEALVRSLKLALKTLPLEASSDHWSTTGDSDGLYQVSVARLGPAAEFQSTTINLPDIPAYPPLFCRFESTEIDGNQATRVKSVLSLRSDRLPDRIGNLRANVNGAVDQLRNNASQNVGAIAVRIRPPSAHGDLWEADRAVRNSLIQKSAGHVTLVSLFWDEKARQVENGVHHENSHRALMTLATYTIENPSSYIRLSGIDSQHTYFPSPPLAFARDPISGVINSIDPDELAEIEAGGDLPTIISEALADLEDVSEAEDEVTFYVELSSPIESIPPNTLMGVVRAGQRQFRAFIDDSTNLRVFEISKAQIKAVATIDLRAWLAEDNITLIFSWSTGNFCVSIWYPDGLSCLKVTASKVRPLLF